MFIVYLPDESEFIDDEGERRTYAYEFANEQQATKAIRDYVLSDDFDPNDDIPTIELYRKFADVEVEVPKIKPNVTIKEFNH